MVSETTPLSCRIKGAWRRKKRTLFLSPGQSRRPVLPMDFAYWLSWITSIQASSDVVIGYKPGCSTAGNDSEPPKPSLARRSGGIANLTRLAGSRAITIALFGIISMVAPDLTDALPDAENQACSRFKSQANFSH